MLDKPNTHKIMVCTIYRPPSGDVSTGMRELTDSIDVKQEKFDAELVIMGDMNVNYRDRHNNAFNVLKEFERVYNLTQLIQDYTRITSKAKSTIDLIWTNMTHIADSGVLDIHLSDHMPIFVVKKKTWRKKNLSLSWVEVTGNM